jgi:RNA polymerase sigma factor (sigma-70 family)
MSKKDYTILGQKVTEEVYKEYYKMDRRRRYLEEDIKVGRIDIDPETGRAIYIPSKEDSYERLADEGVQFEDGQAVEDIVCDKAILLILQEALKELDDKEQELIRDIYYREKTTREIAKENNVSQPAIVKRHKKIIDKFKKYFSESGYQTPPEIG